MKFIDKTFSISRLTINITVVDIFRREDFRSGEDVGYIWPIIAIDVLTIGRSFGFSITIPVMKLSIGWSM
tara:strand:+ start:361 stop:570 length:210 start_codon:yes stop_codon:yes gene_type:complete